jgi:hypothetical protein
MSAALDRWDILVEGAVDCVLGRPRNANPYPLDAARSHHVWWIKAWDEARDLLDVRGAEEASRWLREAA